MENPLIRDADVEFLLYDVLDVLALTRLPYFAEHDRSTFDMVIDTARRFAREVLFPAYRPMDEAPPRFERGSVTVHPRMKAIYPELAALGMVSASRPASVGGQQLPLTITTFATAYLMAANLSAYGYVGLASGAAHLIEAFGDEELKRAYMEPLYEGRFLGTMALTEPQAGSSLADVATRAEKNADGSYSLVGSKIFISGGDHDLGDNIVHMVLARVSGAPAGTKGVSLFCVPKLRLENGSYVDNDVSVSGVIHKIGWRGLPSLALSFGERGDCRGWLVGAENRGLSYMFQMMNEARIMVGLNGVATASVAYHQALAYANDRTQGRPVTAKDPAAPPIAIIEHADVKRMLLRQKAIVEGGLALIARTAMYADLAEHANDAHARLLLDLLTPVAKSFPAERGFEANVLALQIHGGYGYSSEYLPEAWLRDQKLNSLHEGTTGIQGMDLLGRPVGAGDGRACTIFLDELTAAIGRARSAGAGADLCDQMGTAVGWLADATQALGQLGLAGDVDAMLLHSADYLAMFSIVAIAWQWLLQAAVAAEAIMHDGIPRDFYAGKLAACRYWITTELPRVAVYAELCKSGERSFADMRNEWF
jgi:butyryl-CoA dehydrogenase